ncbi:hypothetical protein Tco_0024603 [Tanacetum coccineum]
MPPRMRTQSAGRPATKTLRGEQISGALTDKAVRNGYEIEIASGQLVEIDKDYHLSGKLSSGLINPDYIKEMKDVFKATESDLCETWKQNELLKDQLLEANLKHEIECCVLLSHECVDNNMKDEIEKTRAQNQGEINELFENVKQKTYAYADVRAQNQDLLLTISELRAKLKNVEKGKSVNTKFDKANVSKKLLYTLPNKQQAVGTNKNVIALGMYKVGTSQVTNTNKAKSVLSSTRLSATSRVRRPSNRDSSFRNSVVSNTKNSSEKVEVFDRTNKKPDVASKNVALNTFVTNAKIKNAL